MDRIDFRAFTEEAVLELISCEAPSENIDSLLLHSLLLGSVWEKGLDFLNKHYSESDPGAAEKALSVLIKKKGIKDNLVYERNSFWFRLENGEYRIYKNGATGEVFATLWLSGNGRSFHFSGSRLADFIMQFDTEIPNILSREPAVREVLRRMRLENEKSKMEEMIKSMLIQSLIEQNLKPLNLSANFRIMDGDVVSMDIKQVLSAHLEMPLEQIMEKLKDPESIVNSLQARPEKEALFPEDYFF